MDHTNLLTTILKAFRLDTQNNTLSFLSTFLDELLADDDVVDVGYIALVNHDLWSIHASRGIDFTNTDLQGLRTSDQSSSIIEIQSLTNPVDKVFPYDKASSKAYIEFKYEIPSVALSTGSIAPSSIKHLRMRISPIQ
jgi:hypothetical protein